MHFVYRKYVHDLIKRGVFQEFDKIKDIPVKNKYGADILLTHRGIDMCIRCVYSDEPLTEKYITELHDAKESYGCQELYLITNTVCTDSARSCASEKHIKIKENLPLLADKLLEDRREKQYTTQNYRSRTETVISAERENLTPKTVERIMIEYQMSSGDYGKDILTIQKIRTKSIVKRVIFCGIVLLLLVFVEPAEENSHSNTNEVSTVCNNAVILVDNFT